MKKKAFITPSCEEHVDMENPLLRTYSANNVYIKSDDYDDESYDQRSRAWDDDIDE